MVLLLWNTVVVAEGSAREGGVVRRLGVMGRRMMRRRYWSNVGCVLNHL